MTKLTFTRRNRALLTSLMLLALLAVLALPAFAQTGSTTEASTRVFTAEQINESFRLQASPRLRFSDESVDLQPGQVVVNATLTLRRGEPMAVTSTYVPSVSEGDVLWVLVAASVDDADASDAVVDAINEVIANSWRRYFRQQLDRFSVSAIVIDDNAITVTGTRNPRPDDRPLDDYVDVVDGVATLVLTEQQINDTYRVTNPRGSRIDSLLVDLQPGQAVIYATLTLTRIDERYDVLVIAVPVISDGSLTWTTTGAAVNGETLPTEVLTQIDNILAQSWRRYIKVQYGSGTVTDVVITDDLLTITYELPERGR
ncbi:MAG: hypothetical protein ACOCXZ_00435 [Chloroflexota bacterium]